MKNFLLILTLALGISTNAIASTITQTTSARIDAEFVDLSMSHLDLSTGLEWLNFTTLINGERTDLTMGRSVEESEAWFGPQGWRLAEYSEVVGLFDLFFPSFADSGDGTMLLDDEGNPTGDLVEARNSWLMSFGSHVFSETGDLDSIGLYLDENGIVQEMGVDMTTNPLTSTIYGLDYTEYTTGINEGFANRGVFMVRDFSVVPIPAAAWLFGSGLIALGAFARRKHK